LEGGISLVSVELFVTPIYMIVVIPVALYSKYDTYHNRLS